MTIEQYLRITMPKIIYFNKRSKKSKFKTSNRLVRKLFSRSRKFDNAILNDFSCPITLWGGNFDIRKNCKKLYP